MAVSDVNLRRAFADICNGYSTSTWNDNKIYIKHLSHFDQVDIDAEYEQHFESAKAKGIPTLEQRLAWLDKEKLWTKVEETGVKKQEDWNVNLAKTLKLMPLEIQRVQLKKQIEEGEKKLAEMRQRRAELIGHTSEHYADQKMQAHYLFRATYKDAGLSTPLFTEKQFKRLDEEEVFTLMMAYMTFVEQFNHSILKRISIAPFFTSYFYMSEDLSRFFGKPLVNLSYYQLNLLSYGSYFKHILQSIGETAPAEIKEDPEKLEEWISKQQQMKSTMEKTKNNASEAQGKRETVAGFTAVMGASSKEIGEMGGTGLPATLKDKEISSIEEAIRLTR